ncbi:hypothetical protein F5Y18DRAFT_403178 [Xylariaceae sp. FL1019]|nr:hypothetical protein F5Y18DRAFT_403178 [Xylariaceae sp. FL1019]
MSLYSARSCQSLACHSLIDPTDNCPKMNILPDPAVLMVAALVVVLALRASSLPILETNNLPTPRDSNLLILPVNKPPTLEISSPPTRLLLHRDLLCPAVRMASPLILLAQVDNSLPTQGVNSHRVLPDSNLLRLLPQPRPLLSYHQSQLPSLLWRLRRSA